jgi:hypothetical protein
LDDAPSPHSLEDIVALSGKHFREFRIPVALNSHPYVEGWTETVIERLESSDLALDNPVRLLDLVMARGGKTYLDTLPGTKIYSERSSPTEVHQAITETVQSMLRGDDRGGMLTKPPGVVEYDMAPNLEGRPVLSARPVGVDSGEVVFRSGYAEKTTDRFEASLKFELVGLFDIDELGISRSSPEPVPVDNYVPPMVTLMYDAQGGRLDNPLDIRPSFNPFGYIQQPPLLLTTLEAAQLIRGNEAISAIRIKVTGVDEYSPTAQEKLERIAAEIVRKTGLSVTITAGASPDRMLVFLPGFSDRAPAGYVEEWWPRAGVNVEIRERMQWENLLFFIIVLVVAALYIGNTALVTTLQRWGELGLLKALGWRDVTVARLVVSQFVGPALVAGLLGVLLSQGMANLLGLNLTLSQAIMVIPISLGLAVLGGAAGLGIVRRATPISSIRSGDIRTPMGASALSRHSGTGLWGLAWNSLRERSSTTIVNLIVTAVATGFLVLLAILLQATRGYLWGNFLGSYIMIRVESYHLAMAVVALAVAAVAAADAALLGILRRKAELSVLLAVGWRPWHVLRLVIAEGILLGIIGAVGGLVLGTVAALALTDQEVALLRILTAASPAALVPLVTIPVAVLIAAIEATRLSPARILRGE